MTKKYVIAQLVDVETLGGTTLTRNVIQLLSDRYFNTEEDAAVAGFNMDVISVIILPMYTQD